MGVFRYSRLDFVFTCLGLILFVTDVGLDVNAAVYFYWDGAFWSLGALLLFLGVSSVLVQLYSWLWYSYDPSVRTGLEHKVSRAQLTLLHVLQMGVYFRHAGLLQTVIRGLCYSSEAPKDVAVFLSHDLSMLRIVETFSESCPQLVLMLTLILQQGHLDTFIVIKFIASASAIAFGLTTYHRSLRSFLQQKNQQSVVSSLVYFLWNLLLVSGRLVALALFSSVLPCFIITHFLCSWMMFSFFAWRLHTDFMDSALGEWLYRATVGLIWYFNWFNVVEGRTRYTSLAYHGFTLVDISTLCGVWCWKMSSDPPHFVIPPLYAIIIAVSVVGVYILGLFLKLIYYKGFHPNLSTEQLMGDSAETLDQKMDTVDFPMARVQLRSMSAPRSAPCNKRMRKLAQNFYT